MLPPSNINLSSLLLLFFFIFFLNHGAGLTGAARVYIYSGCSQDKYQSNTPYESNLNSLLSSIVSSSSQTLFNAFAIGNDTSGASAATYGLYQCRGDLKLRDCSTCIANLINQMELVCPYAYGASLQLDECYVRYEDDDFLGRFDTGLRFRRCSPVVSRDGEFLRHRDGVLDDLQRATGFRVSTTGAVEGYAQCLGDLSREDCVACLNEAVAEVKSLCGSAAAGDVFLAQCYVRYWEAGYYDASPDSSNQDDVGKTVAIIVGVIVGIALLIVLLSYCKKYPG